MAKFVATASITTIFILLCIKYWWFTVDDSYIAFRYSKHLVQGYGPVWNVGWDPVEGYTSTLWMLISAIPQIFGLSPVPFVKTVGVLSVSMMLILIVLFARRSGVTLIGLFCAAIIGLNPKVAVLTVQGLETPLAMLQVAVLCVLSYELKDYTRKKSALIGLVAFLSMITRPGLVAFCLPLFFGILAYYVIKKQKRDAFEFILISTVVVAIPSIIYMVVRFQFFGYIFPNAFYIKNQPFSTVYVKNFYATMIKPVFVLSLFSLVYLILRDRKMLIRIVPIILGIIGFSIAISYANPIQAYFYRYIIPVYGAFSAVAILSGKSMYADMEFNYTTEHTIPELDIVIPILILLVLTMTSAAFINWIPIIQLASEEANFTSRDHNQIDRVEVGKALSDIEGDNLSMYTTESGALPYYSGWIAVDRLGLNNESIAHSHTTDQEIISRLKPDLIVSYAYRQPDLDVSDINNISEYHTIAIVNRKYSIGGHYYYIRNDSEKYSEIVCAIRTSDVDIIEDSKNYVTEYATAEC
jgi:hypothetical protein